MSVFTSTVRCDGYNYSLDIDDLNEEVIIEAQKSFRIACDKGFVVAESFESAVWALCDESKCVKSINFTLDEFNFHRVCVDLLGCTIDEYKTTMRVAVTCFFGASMTYLQEYCRALCLLANKMTRTGETTILSGFEIPIQKFLELLPGESEFRDKLVFYSEKIFEERTKAAKREDKPSRTLGYYQSYLRFDDIIKDFWGKASSKEKVLYFPLYFWWTLTNTLPLRPTEFVLTPRNCLRWTNGKPYLTIRRTKVKGTYLGCNYTIKDDYIEESYAIPFELASEIEEYIKHTADLYMSEIDTLFCKQTQFQLAYNNKPRTSKYLYANLSALLKLFYKEVILSSKYGYILREKAETPLNEHEIEKICLGDTRHISMISLMISGKSELICQDLSGHDVIETGQAYYGNVKTFVDAIVWERVRPHNKANGNQTSRLPAKYTKIPDGLCLSQKVLISDFSDCECAVSDDGEIGHCRSCEYFRAPAGKKTSSVPKDDRLRTSFLRLLDAINKAKKGLSTKAEVTAAAMKVQSEVIHYISKEVATMYENGA